MAENGDSKYVGNLLEKIRPIVKEGMTVDEIAKENVLVQVEDFKNISKDFVKKEIEVVGAFYDLESGKVEVL